MSFMDFLAYIVCLGLHSGPKFSTSLTSLKVCRRLLFSAPSLTLSVWIAVTFFKVGSVMKSLSPAITSSSTASFNSCSFRSGWFRLSSCMAKFLSLSTLTLISSPTTLQTFSLAALTFSFCLGISMDSTITPNSFLGCFSTMYLSATPLSSGKCFSTSL